MRVEKIEISDDYFVKLLAIYLDIMNESQLAVKDYEFIQPIIHNLEHIFEIVIGDCHNEYYHKFEYRCTHDIKFTNITNNAIFDLTNSDKSLNI